MKILLYLGKESHTMKLFYFGNAWMCNAFLKYPQKCHQHFEIIIKVLIWSLLPIEP